MKPEPTDDELLGFGLRTDAVGIDEGVANFSLWEHWNPRVDSMPPDVRAILLARWQAKQEQQSTNGGGA
jgi:hypothetical protein